MTRRKINSEDPAVHAVYMNWLAQLVGMICPRNLFLILGRGSGKTNDILTDRLMDICYDMPGAPIALVGDTYDNLSKNILPSLLDGLNRKGWVENVHYVVDREPPEVTEDMRQAAPPELRSQLWTPYNRILSYKRKIIFFTGTNITLVSLDRPSSAAGNSYVHLIGDEAKFFPPHKLAKMTKALRGYFVKYGKSVYYRGQTFLTDMPNPNHVGEYDWILKQFSRMNVKDIMMVIKTAFVLNDVRQEVAVAKCDYNTKELANKEKLLKRWEERFNLVRRNSTFCYVASSYINSDILRPEYFADEFEGDLDDVKISILSTKPRLAAGNMFYAGIGSKHFYNDGTSPKYADYFGTRENEDCRVLRYLIPDKPLDVSIDFGNMMSMVVGQEQGEYFRCLKNLYTLPPAWIRELADKFLAFFKAHEHKVINLYYDRAGNQYQKVKQDSAGKLKAALEKDAMGNSTGWRVNLESRNQPTIYTYDEYDFMLEVMAERSPKLPKVRIDMYHCRELKASLEMAETKIIEVRGRKKVSKKKTSEKLPFHRLPMESTNFSDSFKYMLMRKKWLQQVKAHASGVSLPIG
ncbi:MAG: hypothetical protein J6K74_07830 [Marinifilaceae bacterium]|nr:hypothetical protein [Marinifilaceae bacterium]